MKTIGSFEAKTHLSSLLERVARGEEFTITRHGTPVALLVPVDREAALPAMVVDLGISVLVIALHLGLFCHEPVEIQSLSYQPFLNCSLSML